MKTNKKPMRLQGQALYQELFDFLRRQTGQDGRRLVSDFMKLPPKKEYPDYYSMISYPNDLTTVQQRIADDAYPDVPTFIADVTLVFKNAMVYNDEDSQIVDDAATAMEEFAVKARELVTRQDFLACPSLREKPSPLTTIMLMMLRHLRSVMEPKTGRMLQVAFASLPDQREFRQYYDVIKDPIALSTIHERVDSYYYHNLTDFQADVFKMFTNARLFNESDSQVYNDSIVLQKAFIKRLQALAIREKISSPALSFTLAKLEEVLASDTPLVAVTGGRLSPSMEQNPTALDDGGPEAERVYVESLEHNGVRYQVGEYVMVNDPVGEGGTRIGCIVRLWKNCGIEFMSTLYFYRPSSTFHLASATFYTNEVLRSSDTFTHPVSAVNCKCHVSYIREYVRFTPVGFSEDRVFVCESRYNSKSKTIQRIKQVPQPTYSPELELRPEPLDARSLPRVKSIGSSSSSSGRDAGAAGMSGPDATVAASAAASLSIDHRSVKKASGGELEPSKVKAGCIMYELVYLDGIPFQQGDFVYLKSDDGE